MKKLFCILLLLLLLLAGCVNDTPKEESLPAYSDPIGEYDTVSTVIPEDSESSDNTKVSRAEGSQTEQTENGFSVKYKKYEYEGNHIVIMHVENLTDKHYTVTLKGNYLKADGSIIKTESKTFEGFASGFSNNFIFAPGMRFDDFDYTVEFEAYTSEPVSKYVSVNGAALDFAKFRGRYGELDELYVGVYAFFYISHTYSQRLYYGADFLLLDKNGDIFFVDTQLMQTDNSPLKPGESVSTRGTLRFMFYDENTLWADFDKYQLPDELDGDITGIVAFKWIDTVGRN